MIETEAWVLGTLTTVVILLFTSVVVCRVKITQLEKRVYENQKQAAENRQLLRDINRDINMVERTLMNRISQDERKLAGIEASLISDLQELAASASPTR